MGLKTSLSLKGDSLALLPRIPTASVDVCIADPPYNMSKKKGLAWAFSSHVTMQENWDRFSDDDFFGFTATWIKEVTRIVKPNGNILLFGTYHNIYLMGFILQQLDRKILNSIIWTKPNAQPNITCRMLTESTEQIVWAANHTNKKATNWTFQYHAGKEMNGGKQLRNHWAYPVTARSERVAGHPTQKPLALIERLILLFSHPGDVVLDPFAGVGTTGIAGHKHKRKCLLIEKETKYFNAQKSRFKKAKLGMPEFSIKYPLAPTRKPLLKASKSTRSVLQPA